MEGYSYSFTYRQAQESPDSAEIRVYRAASLQPLLESPQRADSCSVDTVKAVR